MKRIFVILALVLVLMSVLSLVCLAEAADGGLVTEEEKSLRDVLDEWLARGDQTFAGKEWWAVVSTWVRANLDAILACIGGLTALVGSLLMILKSNPKLRAYINSLGTSCKGWFNDISTNVDNVVATLGKETAQSAKVEQSVDKLQQTVVLLVDALEDVIKLSGADETKKDIYIKKIEEAKKSIAEGGDRSEV